MTISTQQILTPDWIAPVTPDRQVLRGHSLVVGDEKILTVSPTGDARRDYPEAEEINLPGHILTPGFVNAHGHAAMTLLRGLADDREMMDWLTNWIWPIEGELVTESFVYDGTRMAALEMILSGTTCVADTYFFPEAAAKAFTDMNFRAQVCMPVLKFDNAWANGEEEHIHKGLAFRDSIRNSDLITTAFAPHAPYTVTDEGFRRIKLYAEQLDVPIHLHLHETATEVSDSIDESGMRPITRLNELGILSPALQAVHMTQLRDDEIELLAKHGAQVAHCPESNMKLASGTCRVHDLRRAGINVALGTDGAASNNDLDMLQEVRTATLMSKSHSGDATSLPAYECLEMITLAGAKFFGLDEKIGSLEAGKLADITAIDLSGPSFQPMYDPVSQLIYTATGRDVTHVWIHGRCVLKDRSIQLSNTESILSSTRAWQEKISERQVNA